MPAAVMIATVAAFTLPNKVGDGWIIIRSSANEVLPRPGARATPAHASLMPKIVGTGRPVVALQTAAGAHHFRFIGIEFMPAAGLFATTLLRLGTGEETVATDLPHDIIVDRCYIHADPIVGGRRGIALNSRSTAIIDSYVSDWKEVGADSQALGGWNGPGPFKIANNYLEAAGENVMFGGADAAIGGLVPSDVQILGNHITKPLAWRGSAWTIKNLLELKSARRLLVEGNVFENNWGAAQDGTAIVVKSANQDGAAPWSVTEDVTFVRNIVRHSASGIRISGRGDGFPAGQTARILIRDNLLQDIDSSRWGGDGRPFILLEDISDLTIDHNTADGAGNALITVDGRPEVGFVFRNNIGPRNEYGIKGSGTGGGLPTLQAYFPGYVVEANAIVGASASNHPPGNFFPPTMDAVGFVDRAVGNYRLASASPYKHAGTDDRDLGADFDALATATLRDPSGALSAPDGSTPAVAFASLANGAIVAGRAVSVSVAAANNAHISGVQFTLDGTSLGVVTRAPYAITWDSTATPNGPRVVVAHAFDVFGNTASASVTVRVSNDTSRRDLAVKLVLYIPVALIAVLALGRYTRKRRAAAQ